MLTDSRQSARDTLLPQVTVVVMAYNEVTSLPEVVREIAAVLDTLGAGAGEILIVDDGSTDGTGPLSDKLSQSDHRVRVIHHAPNLGLGEVYRTGFEESRGAFVTFFPADGQFPASIVPEFLAAIHDRDLVLGYLPRREDSGLGRCLSWMQRVLYRVLVGQLPRFQGVLMLRRASLAELRLKPSGRAASIVFEMILKMVARKHRIVSLPTPYRRRIAGHSKVNNARTVWANVSALVALRGRLVADREIGFKDRPTAPLLWLCVAMATAFAVYQPWRYEPFDILDFSEFLTLLHSKQSFYGRFASLASYYGSQGRVNELGYAIISATYSIWGLRPNPWQMVRVVQVAVVVPAAYLVLRAFGASRFAAGLGSSIYLFGTATASAWLRQTGEPLGTVFMLASTSVALRWYTPDTHRFRRLVVATFCMIGMLLCKETFVAVLPFLFLALVLAKERANSGPSNRVRFGWGFIGAGVTSCLVLGALLLWSRSLLRPDAYANLYGQPVGTNVVLWRSLAHMTLPIVFSGTVSQVVAFPPNLVFLALMAAAVIVGRPWRATTVRLQLGLGLLLLASGLAVYAPWPRFEPFYALPFLFGLSLIVATLTDLSFRRPRSRLVLLVCWGFIMGTTALNAFGLAEYTRAGRALNYEVAKRLAGYDGLDIISIVSGRLTSQPWQNPAATFSRYIHAVQLPGRAPAMRDVACDTRPQWLAGVPGSAPAVVYVGACGDMKDPVAVIGSTYRYFDWNRLTIAQGEQRVAIIFEDLR